MGGCGRDNLVRGNLTAAGPPMAIPWRVCEKSETVVTRAKVSVDGDPVSLRYVLIPGESLS